MSPGSLASPANEYDRVRAERIACDRARMQALGIYEVPQQLFPSQTIRRHRKKQSVPAEPQRLSRRLAVVTKLDYSETSPAKAHRAVLLQRLRKQTMSTVAQQGKPHQVEELDVQARSAAFLGITSNGQCLSHPSWKQERVDAIVKYIEDEGYAL